MDKGKEEGIIYERSKELPHGYTAQTVNSDLSLDFRHTYAICFDNHFYCMRNLRGGMNIFLV